ncbi:MAG: hypothetical protein K2R98_02290 [Gemmataceae bacterium]|nr:hypothetical protein [Gemmataceae bacterium]
MPVMLGMWHTHADGIVRLVAAHPREFALVGFHDADKGKTEGGKTEGVRK